MSLASLDKQAVEQFTRHFETLFDTGDAAGMAAFYAQDARLLAENIELIRGRAAIEQFWRHAIGRAQAAGAVRTISLDEVTSSTHPAPTRPRSLPPPRRRDAGLAGQAGSARRT